MVYSFICDICGGWCKLLLHCHLVECYKSMVLVSSWWNIIEGDIVAPAYPIGPTALMQSTVKLVWNEPLWKDHPLLKDHFPISENFKVTEVKKVKFGFWSITPKVLELST